MASKKRPAAAGNHVIALGESEGSERGGEASEAPPRGSDEGSRKHEQRHLFKATQDGARGSAGKQGLASEDSALHGAKQQMLELHGWRVCSA